LKWLKAAADEIVECIKLSIEELNMNEVEKLIELLLKAKGENIFWVKL